MSETLTHFDGDTLAEVKAQRDALFGAIVDLSVQADAGRYGRAPATLRASERANLEQQYAALWWGRASSDSEESEQWREIARRQNRGESQ